ncbi:MAG: response regulator [Desulfovibrio sp.]
MSDTTNIRILIVDDEVSYTTILTKRLALRGISATPVNSGEEAVQALRGNTFDVALLDLKMENMDGLEVLKIFTVMAPETNVIILTGHGGEQEARESMQLGAFDYVVKPVELDTLVKKIHEAASA